MKQIVHEQTTEIVDSYTGEIVKESVSKTFTIKKDVEPFFLTYSRYMSVLYNLTSLSAVKILWKFLEQSQYNKEDVFITPQRKKEILEELGISSSIYTKSLVMLTEAGIISGSRGTYKINPELHWRGDYKTREKLLNSGCTLTITPSVEFEEGKE